MLYHIDNLNDILHKLRIKSEDYFGSEKINI